MASPVKKILFSVDSKWRDLPSYVLLKGILEKKYGHEVYILPMGSERFYIPFLKPDLVVFNHLLEKKKEALALELKEKGVSICILPTEGAPFTRTPQEVIAGLHHDYSSVDIHFTWNPFMKDLMVKHGVLPDSKVKVTGVPRFDLYSSPADQVYVPKSILLKKYNLDSRFPVVTLATSFTSAKFAGLSPEAFMKIAENLRINNLSNLDDRINWYKKEYATREEVMSIFGKLAADLPEVNFLIKHHPMEEVRFYKAYVKKLNKKGIKNIALISREFIWDVLNASDILLQRSCTTATEAWVLNKPTVQLQVSDHYHSDEHLNTNDIASSYDEVAQIVKEYLSGKEIPQEMLHNRQKVLEKMFFTLDGRSSERCAKFISDFLTNKIDTPDIRATLEDVLKIAAYTVKIFIRNIFYSLPTELTSLHNKLGFVDKRVRRRDVRFWERQISSIVDHYI